MNDDLLVPLLDSDASATSSDEDNERSFGSVCGTSQNSTESDD